MSRKKDAFELLRRANPVPASERESLVERLEHVPRTRTLDRTVVSRSRSPAHRPFRKAAVGVTAGLVGALGALLLVASAFGLRVPVIGFWEAQRAPARVERLFERLSIGAPAGMDPEAISGETRRVGTFVLSDGPHTLWVAPTRQGGFCFLRTRLGGHCARLGTEPLGVSWLVRGREVTEGRSLDLGRTARIVAGHVDADYAVFVEMRFANGTTARPTIVWVSEPISAGFFVHELSELERGAGGISSVVALDGFGDVVAEERGRPSESRGTPAEAILEKRSVAVQVTTRHGNAEVVVAPTRYEGRCAWLELPGRRLRFVPCIPEGYSFGPFAVRFVPTSQDVFLVGAVAKDVARVEVRFADGDLAGARPQGGFVLFELPLPHLRRGREAIAVIARSRRGDVLNSETVHALGGGRFPCLGSLPVRAPRRGAFCP